MKKMAELFARRCQAFSPDSYLKELLLVVLNKRNQGFLSLGLEAAESADDLDERGHIRCIEALFTELLEGSVCEVIDR